METLKKHLEKLIKTLSSQQRNKLKNHKPLLFWNSFTKLLHFTSSV